MVPTILREKLPKSQIETIISIIILLNTYWLYQKKKKKKQNINSNKTK